MTPRVTALLLALIPLAAAGHGDVHGQIDALTARMAADPSNALLRLDRADLYRLHGDLQIAMDELDAAARLDPALDDIALARGRVCLEARHPAEAMVHLARFATRHPNDPAVWMLQARAWAGLTNPLAAADAMGRSIALQVPPDPDPYLLQAGYYLEAGSNYAAAAVAALDRGIDALGPLVVLDAAAIDIEMASGRAAAALRRIDRQLAAAPRKEGWLVRKAELLQSIGRADDAMRCWRAALALVENLPQRQRRLAESVQLEDCIRAALVERGSP